MKHPVFEGKTKGETCGSTRLYYCGKEWTITKTGRRWVSAVMVEAPIDRRFDIKTAKKWRQHDYPRHPSPLPD